MQRKKTQKVRKRVQQKRPGANSADAAGLTSTEVLAPLVALLDAVGVSRREVLNTIRSLPSVKLSRPVNIVRGKLEYWSGLLKRWAEDPQFLGADGRPRDLTFSTGKASFTDLVSIVLPKEKPSRCRDILMETGAVLQLPNGNIRLRRRAALARPADTGVVFADEYLRPLRALLVALQTNLLWKAHDSRPLVFQRAVSGFEVSTEDVSELQSFIARHGTAYLETVDDWIANRQRRRSKQQINTETVVRPYLGLFLSFEPDGGVATVKRQANAQRSTLGQNRR